MGLPNLKNHHYASGASAGNKSDIVHLVAPFGHPKYDLARKEMLRLSLPKWSKEIVIDSVSQLVDVAADYGRIDAPSARAFEVDRDEQTFPLNNIFVGPHDYINLVENAHDRLSSGEGFPFLVVIKMKEERTQPSPKGKFRYNGEKAPMVRDDVAVFYVRPVLTCEESVDPFIFEATEQQQTLLVAGHPFIHQGYNERDECIDIYFNIEQRDQFSVIDSTHWSDPIPDMNKEYDPLVLRSAARRAVIV